MTNHECWGRSSKPLICQIVKVGVEATRVRPRRSVRQTHWALLLSFSKCDRLGELPKRLNVEANGTKAGIDGTQTFSLGVTDASGERLDLFRRLQGAMPFPNLKE